jgi:signal transduction histidine kinase
MVADISGRKMSEQKVLEARDQLQKLSAHLKNTREDERKLISREVHDQLGQLGSAIKIELDWLSINEPVLSDKGKVHLQNALAVVKILIQTTRQLAASLRPAMLDELGLIASLKWQCAEFTKISAVECVFEPSCDDSGLSLSLRTELFRICQEALTNVMRHAEATLVKIGLYVGENNIILEISDNGKGFDTTWDSGHLGLIGIRERIYSVNGEFQIESTPGKGTKLTVKAPLN